MKITNYWFFPLAILVASHAGAQSIASATQPTNFLEKDRVPGTYSSPEWESAACDIQDPAPVVVEQNLGDLTCRPAAATAKKSRAAAVFQNPSPFRHLLVSAQAPVGVPSRALQKGLATAAAAYGESGAVGKTIACDKLSRSFAEKIEDKPEDLLELVEREVSANPSCVCEIVKTAIKISEADADKVAAIVETVIRANPEHMRIASQCAIATAPESIAAVQSVLARLEQNSGEGTSAKSGKDVIANETTAPEKKSANPLDRIFFGIGEIGGSRGNFTMTPIPPPVIPPVILPPGVTDVD